MMKIAQTTDERAALESGTVKKRMRMCGRPAVPRTSAIPSDTVSIGLDRNVPGPSENVDLDVVLAAARLKSSIGLKPTRSSTNTDITRMAVMSRIALMICTHVVTSI